MKECSAKYKAALRVNVSVGHLLAPERNQSRRNRRIVLLDGLRMWLVRPRQAQA
jgi:hypothetical protein